MDEEDLNKIKNNYKLRPRSSVFSRINMFSFIIINLVCILLSNVAHAQKVCQNYDDFFLNLNKYDPEFDSISYVSKKIRVDKTYEKELIRFKVYDKDYELLNLNNISLFTLSTNNSIFNINPDYGKNEFYLSLNGNLSYNIDNTHRYVVEMTACDTGVPRRCGKALVFVPLMNYNVHAPSYTNPTILVAAVTFNIDQQLGILNSWDLDGDNVNFALDSSNDQTIRNTIQVQSDGRVILKALLTQFSQSFTFYVKLTDDGISCDDSGAPRITKTSIMAVIVRLIEVNMHSPKFIPLPDRNNYCEQTFRAAENSFFRINIAAQDDDTRGENGLITFLAPEITDRSPQNSFNIYNNSQQGRNLNGYVYNLETFDYENPKYGSNIMNIMVIAEDRGLIRRRGYCFMTIEIIDINDNIPVFSQRLYTIYMHEQYKTRQFSYRFIAVDKDSGLNGTVQYFMDPRSNAASLDLFSLDLNGTLTLRENILDKYKDIQMFEFDIYAQDMSPFRNRSESVQVKVIRTTLKLLPPFFSDFPSSAEIRDISEMTTRGSILRNFSISIQTAPANQFLRCLLSPKPNPEWFKFDYVNTNKDLSRNETCSLKIEDPLNYRVAKSMIVYLVAENGNYQMSSTARELKILTIYLKEENINPPKFVTNTIEASVVEGKDDLGKVIAIVKAYDLDLTQPYNTITYEFDSKSNLDQYFSINETTGEIKLINIIQNKKNIPLEVFAKDGANGYNMDSPNRNSIYVDVKVIDINDNEPVFGQSSYQFDVPENAQPGYVIGRLEVSDPDTESYFNYSISDSTFGIRGIFDQTKTKSYSNYRGSAEIYLNNYLDYKKKSVYQLLTFVSDSFFVVNCSLIINVININDRPPEFINTPYIVNIDEGVIPRVPLVTLAAKDEDNLNSNFIFEIYPTPFFSQINEWFNLEPNGQLSLIKELDRDPPFGMEIYKLPVSVAYQSNPSLKSYTTVEIKLRNINDNPPYLLYGSNKPLIIDEERNSGAVELFVDDVDGPGYGKPFTLILQKYQDLFNIQKINCLECQTSEKFQLISTKLLSRENQKIYAIPYSVTDVGGLTRTGFLKLIVGDIDNNPQSDGQKLIKILSIEKNIQPNSFLGTLYVKDKDDWDVSTKTSSKCVQTTGNSIQVETFLRLIGPKNFDNFPRDSMNLQCEVTDKALTTALAKVDFTIDNVEYADMIDLAAIRLLGITPEEFMKKLDLQSQSILERFLIKLVNLFELNQQTDILKLVTVKSYESPEFTNPLLTNEIPSHEPQFYGTDMYFFIRKNNKLISSRRIYDIIWSQIKLFEAQEYTEVKLLFDECKSNAKTCPDKTFCKQNFIPSQKSLTIDANATSFVGLKNELSRDCYCNLEVKQPTCFNGGSLVYSKGGSDYFCNCLDGYEGPRCEFLSITFIYNPSNRAHSYALFDKIEPCDPMRLEFEFTTERPKGLLLFNGPINRDSLYFIAVEIVNKSLLVHIGPNSVSFPDIYVNDKQWHKVDIAWSLNAVQVNLDKCNSQTIYLSNYDEIKNDIQVTDDFRLILGGIPPAISTNHYYYNQLNVFEYEGCVRNLRVNGDLRNLKLRPNEFNSAQNLQQCDCIYLNKCDSNLAPVIRSNEFPWWIIIIILGALACLALILGLAVCTMRRKDNQKKMLQMFPDDDIRETIINYADGAGEENTENFNIGVMKKPVGPIVQTINTNIVTNGGGTTHDMCSNDQNMIFAYEGEGSEVGSLSSVGSNCEDKDIDLEYLDQWGPKFVKLASIYTRTQDPNGVIDYQNHGYEYTDDYRAPR
ncbi:unnamed protein product [Brachionus calyciflorus]|uniref:Uncharacterized protein n=2 Tax=Brachionus calyciflorus TaxID=104777 RepID=A0A813ND36_9BILA|nr:unnamed protein product [Brachionus calyciflorus]